MQVFIGKTYEDVCAFFHEKMAQLTKNKEVFITVPQLDGGAYLDAFDSLEVTAINYTHISDLDYLKRAELELLKNRITNPSVLESDIDLSFYLSCRLEGYVEVKDSLQSRSAIGLYQSTNEYISELNAEGKSVDMFEVLMKDFAACFSSLFNLYNVKPNVEVFKSDDVIQMNLNFNDNQVEEFKITDALEVGHSFNSDLGFSFEENHIEITNLRYMAYWLIPVAMSLKDAIEHKIRSQEMERMFQRSEKGRRGVLFDAEFNQAIQLASRLMEDEKVRVISEKLQEIKPHILELEWNEISISIGNIINIGLAIKNGTDVFIKMENIFNTSDYSTPYLAFIYKDKVYKFTAANENGFEEFVEDIKLNVDF